MNMKDYDIRQFSRMKKQVESYERGAISLQSLIGDLIFLRDALSEVKEEWEYEFTARISDLESVNAYALENSCNGLEAVSQKIVDDTLPKIRSLIAQAENL